MLLHEWNNAYQCWDIGVFVHVKQIHFIHPLPKKLVWKHWHRTTVTPVKFRTVDSPMSCFPFSITSVTFFYIFHLVTKIPQGGVTFVTLLPNCSTQ